MFLRDETYTNEHGIEMKKEYYGYYDEEGKEVVTATVEEPNNIEPTEPEPTQLDRIEETVNSIATGQNENTEAIDALLGV